MGIHTEEEYEDFSAEFIRHSALPRPYPPGPLGQHEQPSRAGRLWNDEEDKRLLAMHEARWPLSLMSRALCRTELAVEMRLEKLNSKRTWPIENLTKTAKELNKMKTEVNYTHLITLMQKDYTTVAVVFDFANTSYTYKTPLSAGLKIGDSVVCYAKDRMVVGVVGAVHEEPEIDFTQPYALKWIVQKVDVTAYDEQITKEAAAIAHLKKNDKKRAQEKALADLFGSVEDRDEILKLLNGS